MVKDIKNTIGGVLDEVEDSATRAELQESMSISHEIYLWQKHLSAYKAAEVFDAAAKEYELSCMSASSGFYRASFFHLRLFLELAVAFLQFTIRDIDYEKWKLGEKDIIGSSFFSQGGVITKDFCRVYCSELEEKSETYIDILQKIYRECSEKIHGNWHTITADTYTFSFNESQLALWCTKSKDLWASLQFFIFVKVFHETFQEAERELKETVIANLGHIPKLRELVEVEGE